LSTARTVYGPPTGILSVGEELALVLRRFGDVVGLRGQPVGHELERHHVRDLRGGMGADPVHGCGERVDHLLHDALAGGARLARASTAAG